MRCLMRQRCVIAFRVLKSLEAWHLHEVGLDGVIRSRATVADVGASVAEEGFSFGDPLHGIEHRRGGCYEFRGQAVDLFAVEHRVTLEERDFVLNVVAVGVGVGSPDAVGVNDKTAVLTLANLRAKFLRLLVGHPDWARETMLHRFAPQRQDIDAAIGFAVMAEWTGNPSCCVLRVPRLQPRTDALLKVCDNAACDPRIEVASFG